MTKYGLLVKKNGQIQKIENMWLQFYNFNKWWLNFLLIKKVVDKFLKIWSTFSSIVQNFNGNSQKNQYYIGF